jgi:hypothetical protein
VLFRSEKIGFKLLIFINIREPTKANIIAGIPNLMRTSLFAFFPTNNNLNILLKKCTTPVSAIANSTGKKTIKTGVKIVPKPNPEKNVSIATKKAINDIIKISISNILN